MISHKTFVIVFLLLLCACVTSACNGVAPKVDQPVLSPNLVSSNIESETIVEDISIDNKHISMSLDEKLEIDAEVKIPKDQMYSSYLLESVQLNPEQVLAIFAPKDSSEFSFSQSDHDPFGFTLTTANGTEIVVNDGIIRFWTNSLQRDLDIIDLLSKYANSNDELKKNDVGFISMEDAIAASLRIIQEMNISFTPILETCVSMTHIEIMELQANLMTDDRYSDSMRIGKTVDLNDLTENDDSVYLAFCFENDGLPVYGLKNEPGISFADNAFAPSKTKAEILITPQGVRYFVMSNAFTIIENYETGSLITVESALESLKNKYELVILSQNLIVSSAWVEYIPVLSGGKLMLCPYWCFAIKSEYIDESTGQKQIISGIKADRFNAFTGDDITYVR